MTKLTVKEVPGVLDAVHWIDLPSNVDERGVLTSIESGQDIPFEIKRLFYMHHIATDRGGHAHTDTEQVVTAAAGRFKMDLSDGISTRTYILDDPTRGVYTPPMVFIKLYDFSPGAVCLVLASTHYDIEKSLRSWEAYLEAIGS
ncbi:MAG: FdtA/QdtA family cupin domain-containing protein [Anaerolineae bacterium]|nr:FdtA/QdtA family cupin domain-containing protein [Anaerolineae bacterium]